MSVQPPVPNPSLPPLTTDEVPTDPAREERPVAAPDGDVVGMPDVMNPIK